MTTPNRVETGSDSHERRLTPTKSLSVKISEDRPLEKDVEESPVTPTDIVDDFPEGGTAGWCVVLGVSKLTVSPCLDPDELLNPDHVVDVCYLCNVGHIPQTER